MAKRNSRNTRGRIISAAWKLFYEQGYDGTTVEDIVFESGTSKGSFYHYFDGKDALMGTLAYVFDEKYEDLMPTLGPAADGPGDLRGGAVRLPSLPEHRQPANGHRRSSERVPPPHRPHGHGSGPAQ